MGAPDEAGMHYRGSVRKKTRHYCGRERRPPRLRPRACGTRHNVEVKMCANEEQTPQIMAEQVSGRLAIYDLDRSEVVAIRLHRETTPIAAPYRSRHYDGEQLLGRDTFRRQWK